MGLSLVLITGTLSATTTTVATFCFDSYALSLPSSALRFALWLLLGCLCQGSWGQLLRQEVCEVQLEAVRQVTAVSSAPCTPVTVSTHVYLGYRVIPGLLCCTFRSWSHSWKPSVEHIARLSMSTGGGCL